MKCPYCKKEMKKGKILSYYRGVVWTPENEKPSIIVNRPKDYEVQLARQKYIHQSEIIMHRCESCEIEIIDENEQKNKKSSIAYHWHIMLVAYFLYIMLILSLCYKVLKN